MFEPLIDEAELESGLRRVFECQGHSLLLICEGDEIWLIDNRCPHLGFPISGGEVEDGVIRCPHHRFRFSLADGSSLSSGVFCDPLRQLTVQRQDGKLGFLLAELMDW